MHSSITELAPLPTAFPVGRSKAWNIWCNSLLCLQKPEGGGQKARGFGHFGTSIGSSGNSSFSQRLFLTGVREINKRNWNLTDSKVEGYFFISSPTCPHQQKQMGSIRCEIKSEQISASLRYIIYQPGQFGNENEFLISLKGTGINGVANICQVL